VDVDGHSREKHQHTWKEHSFQLSVFMMYYNQWNSSNNWFQSHESRSWSKRSIEVWVWQVWVWAGLKERSTV